MKQITLITLFIAFSCLASGQKTANAYFAMLPDIPANCCSLNDSSLVKYTKKLNEIKKLIDQDVRVKSDAFNKFIEDHKEDAEATAMKSPCTAMKSSPHSPQLQKKPMCSHEDPVRPKISK